MIDKKEVARMLYAAGVKWDDIVKLTGLSKQTISRATQGLMPRGRGRSLGRQKIAEEKVRLIQQLTALPIPMGYDEIARIVGVSKSTIARHRR